MTGSSPAPRLSTAGPLIAGCTWRCGFYAIVCGTGWVSIVIPEGTTGESSKAVVLPSLSTLLLLRAELLSAAHTLRSLPMLSIGFWSRYRNTSLGCPHQSIVTGRSPSGMRYRTRGIPALPSAPALRSPPTAAILAE